MKNTTKIIILLSIIWFFVAVIFGYFCYNQGFISGYNSASYDWCSLFNSHADLTNELIEDLIKYDSFYEKIPKLNYMNCSYK